MPERVALARTLGAQASVGDTKTAIDDVMEQTQGAGVEVAIDCSGSGDGRLLSLQAAAVWGRVVFLGEGGTVSFEPSPLLIRKQLTLYGSWVGSMDSMAQTLEFLTRWDLHPEQIVTHRFPLHEAETAYRIFAQGSTGKVVLLPG
jgi:threonine dehydrogenase-like Zn-dependent dehydrogenase